MNISVRSVERVTDTLSVYDYGDTAVNGSCVGLIEFIMYGRHLYLDYIKKREEFLQVKLLKHVGVSLDHHPETNHLSLAIERLQLT